LPRFINKATSPYKSLNKENFVVATTETCPTEKKDTKEGNGRLTK
jgi:hypothetical protein